MAYEAITVDPAVMGGLPCLRGHRIPVATVVTMVADGMTTDEIWADLPDLKTADVAEALRFAAAAVRERELPLRRSTSAANRWRPPLDRGSLDGARPERA